MPPWDKYAAQPAVGPWAKYANAPEQAAPPTPEPAPAAPPVVPGGGVPNEAYGSRALTPQFPDAVAANPNFADPNTVPDPNDPSHRIPRVVTKDPDIIPQIVRKLKLGTQDVGAGIADIAGTPADLTAAAVNALMYGAEKVHNTVSRAPDISLPRVDNPPGGSAGFQSLATKAADAVGFNPIPEQDRSPVEKLIGRTNEFAAASAAPGALLREAALVKAANPTRMPAFGDGFTRPYESGDVRPLIGDIGAGAGAGTASETAQEHIPDNWKGSWKGDLATLVASLVGGAGGATGSNIVYAPKAAYQTVRDMVSSDPNLSMANGRPFSRSEANQVAEFVQGQSDNPSVAAANIKDRAAEARAAGLPVPPTGILSGDIGLGAAERGLRVADPVPFVRKDQAIRTAAAEKMSAMDDPNANPAAVPDFFTKEAKTRTDAADAAVNAAEQKNLAAVAAEQATGNRYTNLPPQSASSEALDKTIVDETLKPRQAQKNAKFDAIPDAQRDVTPLVTAASRVRDSLGALNDPNSILPQGTLQRIEALAAKTETTPGEPATFKVDPQGVSEKVSGGPVETTTGGTVSFQDMNKLRPELTDGIRAARRAGNYTLSDNLKALKREIGNEAQRMAAEGSPQAADALKYFKEEYAPYFGDGTVGGKLKDAINKDTDRVNTPPSATADRFLSVATGGKEAATDLKNILSIAPNAAAGNQAVRNYVLADLGKTVKADGTIDPNRLRGWIKSRSDVLGTFPAVDGEVQKLLQDVVNNRTKTNATAVDLKDAVRSAKLTERDINQGALGLVLGKNPGNAVRDVLGSGNPEKAMGDVLKIVGKDPEALAGWKQSVKDHINDNIRGSNTQTVDNDELPVQYARMKSMFDKNAGALRQVFTPEEMNAAQQVQKELSYYGGLSRGATVASPTAENITNSRIFKAAEIGWRFLRGQIAGGGEVKGVKNSLNFMKNERDGVRELMLKFAFDPEAAQYLLTRPVDPRGIQKWNAKLNAVLGVTAPARMEATEQKDNNDSEQKP